MKYLIAQPHAGLGNRIRCLVSASRAASKLGRQLAVYWTLDSYHCWCPLDRLFANAYFTADNGFVTGAWQLEPVESYVIRREPNLIRPDLSKTIHLMEENFAYVMGDEGVMWGQFGPDRMSNTVLRDELLSEFNKLVPSHYISREVARAMEMIGDNSIGVHIRREDNVWSNRNCLDSMFIDAIDRKLASIKGRANIFLATDGLSSEQVIRRRYGSRVSTYPVRSYSRGSSPESVEDALVTMLLLSKTQCIIRSCSSTFSQCSAWFGCVPTIDVGRYEHTH